MNIDEFELSVRAMNCLRLAGVRSTADLVQLSESDLLSLPNLGRSTLREIKEWMASYGLELSQTWCLRDETSSWPRPFLFAPGPPPAVRLAVPVPITDQAFILWEYT